MLIFKHRLKVNKASIAEVLEPYWKNAKLSQFLFAKTKISEGR